jgi:hypothetical protein
LGKLGTAHGDQRRVIRDLRLQDPRKDTPKLTVACTGKQGYWEPTVDWVLCGSGHSDCSEYTPGRSTGVVQPIICV